MSEDNREPAAKQLTDYLKKLGNGTHNSATTTFGTPNPNINASQTVGKNGPILLQDWYFLDEMSHFTRERIPERVVHAKGAAAFGYFEVTHDITQYSGAKVFSRVGKKTPIAVRFSQVVAEMGSADTVRDVRGFAVKFYTEDGIWDLVGNNTPVFFIRDAILFPSFVHVLKRNPVTHVPDWDMFWDMMTLRPETTHQLLILYSDRGTPASYRNMHGFGSHTFTLINSHGVFYYCKFHYKTDQGIKNLDPDKATKLAGEDPNYLLRDLYNAIASENYPSWSFFIQIMTVEEATTSKIDPFDVTKVWPHDEYPLIPVGKFHLTKNPRNYFAEVEQLAFNPAHMPPGIGPSPDRMLQGRLFAYSDTHKHRLGTNSLQLPVNAPFHERDFARDGLMTLNNQGGAPNYHPNSFGGPESSQRAHELAPHWQFSGDVGKYDNGGPEYDNYGQARNLYLNVMKDDERVRVADNIVSTLKYAADFLQKRAVKNFSNVDAELGRRITVGLNAQKKAHADL